MFSQKQEPEKVLFFPKQTDLLNDVEGTIVFDFSFPEEKIEINGELPDTILFLSSDTIPGLSISYSVDSGIFYGGLPIIKSKKVDIIDKDIHQLSYGFDTNSGIQSLYLDGKLLAEGEYHGKVDVITGMIIYQEREYILSPIGIHVSLKK